MGRVASQARKRDGREGGKTGHDCLSSTRPGAGVFIAGAIRMAQVRYGTTDELKREKEKHERCERVKSSYKHPSPYTGDRTPESELTVERFEGDASPMGDDRAGRWVLRDG